MMHVIQLQRPRLSDQLAGASREDDVRGDARRRATTFNETVSLIEPTHVRVVNRTDYACVFGRETIGLCRLRAAEKIFREEM